MPKSSTSRPRSALAIIALAAATACAHAVPSPAIACDAAEVRALKAAGFVPSVDAPATESVPALAACLGSPDPVLRDEIAYTGLATLLRGDHVAEADRRALMADLLNQLQASDPDGVRHPFAALVLAEIVRTDRVSPWLTASERETLLQAATAYVTAVRDYRGFDEIVGWRHGVAHGADWLMQITLNPAYGRPAHLAILDAVRAQVRVSDHAYIRGEGERLARPVLFIFQRETLDAADWQAWLSTLADPEPLAAWDEAFTTTAALNRLHNLKAILFALALQTPRDTDNAMPGLSATLRSLP